MRRSDLLLLLVGGFTLCSATETAADLSFCGPWRIEDNGNGKARLVITHPAGNHSLLHLHETRIYDMRNANGALMGVVSENLAYVQGLVVGEVLSPTEFSPNVNPTCNAEHLCPSSGTRICVTVGGTHAPFAPPSPPVSPDLNFQANFAIEDDSNDKARMRFTRADGEPHGLLDQQYVRLLSNNFTFEDGTSPGVASRTVMCDVDRLQLAHDDHQLDRNRARRQQQELRHEHLVPKQRYRRGRGRRAGISLGAAKPSVAAVPDHSKPADSSGGKHPPWPGHRPVTRRPPARGGTVCYLVHQVPQARHEAAV
jgi:hypothetical protein